MHRVSSTGTIQLFTFREGLLAAVGHDLRLTLQRFELDFDDRRVTGTFWPESLHVDGAMRGGALDARAISEKDLRDIRDNLVGRKILDVARHREIRFDGTVSAAQSARPLVAGTLWLRGRGAEIALAMRAGDGRLRSELTLVPSRWGIPPFKALLGTLKIQNRVELAFDLPDPRVETAG